MSVATETNVQEPTVNDAVAESPVMHAESTDQGDFAYKPITPLAPLALFFGICAPASLLGIPGTILAAGGVVVAILALWRIRVNAGEVGGVVLGRVGLVLSTLFCVLGTTYHSYLYATEVPEGYERVSFSWLSKQKPINETGIWMIPEELEALNGKQVFIKGYMYPQSELTGIEEFVLCKDTDKCCFGGQPEINDLIKVKFVNETRAKYRELQLVSVAGILRAEPRFEGGKLSSYFRLEGTHFQ